MIIEAIGIPWDIWRLVKGFGDSKSRNGTYFSPSIRGASSKLGEKRGFLVLPSFSYTKGEEDVGAGSITSLKSLFRGLIPCQLLDSLSFPSCTHPSDSLEEI